MARTPKPAGRKSNLERQTSHRSLRDTFLIVCEGEKTEPNYFKSFRVPKNIVTVIGAGSNTMSVVNKAIEYKQNKKYDQVWCVFDIDSFSPQNVNNALSLAKDNDIQVAYSNEAFELWYLLHFDYHDTALSRKRYKPLLTKKLGFTYQKNDPDLYEYLEDRQQDAIRNATRLLKDWEDNHRPAYDNPCTTVHLLVQALNKVAV